MTTRSNGPSAGWGWLTNGFSVGFRHPKPLLGGAAMLMVACLLPSLVTLPMQYYAVSTGTPQSPATVAWIMGFSMLAGLLTVPLYAGYLQVVDAAERGMPARAMDTFNPYRNGEALRVMGFGLANLALYVLLIGIVVVLTGGGIASWYMQTLAAQAAHQAPPGLPAGFGTIMALFLVVGLFMMGFYAISLGQVALSQRSVFGAIGDGMVGALKNLLPLLVFLVSSVLASIVVLIGFLVVGLLLVFLGKLLTPWLILVLIVPLYIALFLVMFTVMFGVMYHLWRDVCGDDSMTDMVAATAA
ncbi:hypothetical protein [Dyella amyloliquefaciens]|uniref:hypothetical protein n=1 Tax=Dyella amyloliquefaciens TaxID=1770545 RepID=UPI00102EC4CF|nr:hypothetical protein [Dyella amyloliquefaciens]